MDPVAQITGLGLATPLGGTLEQTWVALLESRYITDHSRVPDVTPCDELRVNHLAKRVAREAVSSAGWSESQIRNAALVVGTSKGPVEAWLKPDQPSPDNPIPLAGRPCIFGMAGVAASIAQELRLQHGPRLTLSAACASGLHAIIRAALLIRSGEADRVLVVAAESSLHPLFVQSFRRLGVLPPEGVGCKPFDQNRAGFLMSEAAAAVCLEACDSDSIKPGRIVLDRYAIGGDATHLTAGDAQARTHSRLLAHVIDSRPIDLVHAHGTGTLTNDPIELSAIESAISSSAPVTNLYSHKGALGHSLGAAGLVSVVINCLAHQRGIVPPNPRTDDPLNMHHVTLTRCAAQRSVRRSIALAAGFGGAVGVVGITSR